MLSIAVAPANAPAINSPPPVTGEQSQLRCQVLRLVRRNRRTLMRASSSRLPCFPMALKKSESREASTAWATGDDNDDSAFSLLTAVTSRYNEIVVLDTPKARFLLLDSSRLEPSHSSQVQQLSSRSHWGVHCSSLLATGNHPEGHWQPAVTGTILRGANRDNSGEDQSMDRGEQHAVLQNQHPRSIGGDFQQI